MANAIDGIDAIATVEKYAQWLAEACLGFYHHLTASATWTDGGGCQFAAWLTCCYGNLFYRHLWILGSCGEDG